eukprot:m.50163 g.50163  ORF g.50163 m.50163 type:complete len:825 (-) comp10650_c0_seq1:23-2497(-)
MPEIDDDDGNNNDGGVNLHRAMLEQGMGRILAAVQVKSVKQAGKTGLQRKGHKSLVCLVLKEEKIWLHKVKVEKDASYSIRSSHTLNQLLSVDGINSRPDNKQFALEFERVTRWQADDVNTRSRFLHALWTYSNRFIEPELRPAFKNLTFSSLDEEDEGEGDQPITFIPESDSSSDEEEKTEVEEYHLDLDPEQQADINEVLTDQDWTSFDADTLSSDLSKELEQLDQANIVAILHSNREVNAVLEEIEVALERLEEVAIVVDASLDSVTPVRSSVRRVIESLDNIDTRSNNERALRDEVSKLTEYLNFPREYHAALATGVLSKPTVIESCNKGIAALRIKEKNLPQGLEDMDEVRQKRSFFSTLKKSFAERFENFFSTRVLELTQGNVPSQSRRNDLEQYSFMAQWLKEVKTPSTLQPLFDRVCETYGGYLNELIKSKVSRACKKFKENLGPNRPKTATGNEELLARETFARSLEAMLSEELSFLVKETIFAKKLFTPPSNENDKAVQTMLRAVVSGIKDILCVLVDNAGAVDMFYYVPMMLRFQKHEKNIPAEASNIRNIVNKCIQKTSTGFDSLVSAWVSYVSDCKTPRKKLFGILSFVDDFAGFVENIECHMKEVEDRGRVNMGLVNVATAVEEKILAIAQESKYEEVVLFENFHRLHHHLRNLKVECLISFRTTAKAKYTENLQSHVQTMLGRPLPALYDFFAGVERLIQSGTPAQEVGYQMAFSKQELKKVIESCPARDVKKALENVYKGGVEKLISGEDTTGSNNLRLMVWGHIQKEFMEQYQKFVNLIQQCYPGSDIQLSFNSEQIQSYFTNIAPN